MGLRTRKLRAALSTLGVAIGIAAMVGVLGLSESSRSDLLSQLDELGTNLLSVEASEGFGNTDAELSADAEGMVARIGPVTEVSAAGAVDATVRRTDLVDEGETGGISVVAAGNDLVETLNGAVAAGTFLDDSLSQYPNVVLGSIAAERLAITGLDEPVQVWIGERWWNVVGLLDPFPLAGDLDRSAIVGMEAGEAELDHSDPPAVLYVRTDDGAIDDVRAVLPLTVNRENPEEVSVSRPSDAIEARAAAETAFTSLFLGLGAVALLVGGIGIANVMVIAVIERRSEIGLRRALGATRAHIRQQFLAEALVLAFVGGVAGVVMGAVVTAAYATTQGWEIIIPISAAGLGIVASLLIGGIAGLYPAVRAARLAPTEALRST